MKNHRKLRTSAFCMLICMMMIMTLLPLHCFAAEESGKVVRVAYVNAPGYQEGGENEYKTGYGYEYLQKIAGINNWKYEYVYGTFSELLKKLKAGEVDLMGNLSYTEERAEAISYGSYEQGKENYYLYGNRNHNVIDPLDYTTINGKKIGANAGSNQEKLWQEWCSEHEISCEIIEFENSADRQAALNSGEIDATIGGTVQQDEVTAEWQVLINFGSSPFYFGVNKARPDLLTELNSAQKEILEANPFYNEEVHNRYMKTMALTTTRLDADEKNWLQENKEQVTVGYLKGFQPISYQDENDSFKGIAADLLEAMEQQYAEEGIQIEAVAYQDYESMISALKSGMISAAWPVYSDYWNADQSGFALANKVASVSMTMVFDGDYTEQTVQKIGINKAGSLSKTYAKINYPESEAVEFDSYEDAIHALLRQEVTGVLYETSIYQVNEVNSDMLHSLNKVALPETIEITFAVTQKNKALASILNKGILAFGEAGVNRSLLINSAVERKVTLKDYFEQHPLASNLLIGMVLAIAAGAALLLIYNRMSMQVKKSQAEKEVYERISNTDPLTGLYNRQAVFRKCQELLKKYPDEQFAMAHIDMVHFRLYNTFYGDDAGDKLLCDIADVVRRLSKEYDHLAYGRIEADVFCAFFPYEKTKYQQQALGLLKFFKNYRSDFLIEPKMGVYFVTDADMPVEAMFTRATLAAKEVQPSTPYSTVVYDKKLENTLNEKQQIINEMQAAVDEEQFKVYLQPKYSLRTNQMVGAEALVRWFHPSKGMISPGVFIPVFETNGFITTLDRYMWEHVCQLLSEWQKTGRPMVPVSVNVSRISMFGSTTVGFLKKLIKKYEIDPKYLELELTESAYMDDPEEMKLQLHALKEAGFTILLDDFGSGYSSLNTLREIPVDVLKLDMKFLSLNQTDIRGGLVISSVIRMAKLLSLAVIAEGVETQEQADYLKEVGCEYVQGYLFARPMPVADFENELAHSDTALSDKRGAGIERVGHILAETGSGIYEMGTVFPTPLVCMEYSGGEFKFLRVNSEFFSEFKLEKELTPASQLFKKRMTAKSHAALARAIEESRRTGQKTLAPVLLSYEDGSQQRYCCRVSYEGTIGTTVVFVAVFIRITEEVLALMDEQICDENGERRDQID